VTTKADLGNVSLAVKGNNTRTAIDSVVTP
jgi:hypothetical protein